MGSSSSVISDDDKTKLSVLVSSEFKKCEIEKISELETNTRIFQVFKTSFGENYPNVSLNQDEVVAALRKAYAKDEDDGLNKDDDKDKDKSDSKSDKNEDKCEDKDNEKQPPHLNPRRKSLDEILHSEPSIPVRQTHGSHNHGPLEKPKGIFDDPFKHHPKKLKKMTGRRRSFDQEQHLGQDLPANLRSISSVSVSHDKEEETGGKDKDKDKEEKEESYPEIDHWDSVSQQPFCKYCRMTFKNIQIFERHEKFSEVHAINTGKREKVIEKTPLAPYVDGIDYKLIYHGTKFFWKSHNSFEMHFFHHMPLDIIEVLVNDVETKFELSRTYLDYKVIAAVVQEGAERSCSAQIQDKISHDKFAHDDTIEHEALRAQILQKAVVEYILKRLMEAEHETETVSSSSSSSSSLKQGGNEGKEGEEGKEGKGEELKPPEPPVKGVGTSTSSEEHKPDLKKIGSGSKAQAPAFGANILHPFGHGQDIISVINPSTQINGPAKPLPLRGYIDYLHPNPHYELKHGNYTHIDYKVDRSDTKDKGDDGDGNHEPTHELVAEEERKILEEIFRKKPKTKGVTFIASLVDTTSALLPRHPELLQPIPVEIHVPIVAFTKSVEEVIHTAVPVIPAAVP